MRSAYRLTLLAALAIASFPMLALAQAPNLVINGGFEAPAVGATAPSGCTLGGANSWIYCPSDYVDGWDVVKVAGGSPYNLEFQRVIPPIEGLQYVELASHPGPDARVSISQKVENLCAIDRYTLSYSARKRVAYNNLQVTVNGVSTSTPPDIVVDAWKKYDHTIFGVTSVEIAFAEVGSGSNNTLGTYLDGVSLTNDFYGASACPILDAKPGSYPNGVNLCNGNGVVPVAFVGNANFNPSDWTILGVSLVTDGGGSGVPIVGKGKAEVCKIEDVVDGTNPDMITPDGFADVVCQIPAVDLAATTDTSGETTAEAKVCLMLQDPATLAMYTVCASDELKLARTCTQ